MNIVSNLEPVIRHFAISGAPVSCEEYGSGHINRTYQVKTDDGHAYILQRINRFVFNDPKAVMENVGAVTEFLRARADDPREALNFILSDTGVYYHIDGEGEFWRCYEFADGVCLEAPESEQDFYESAIAFGRFQELLREFPAETLHETIPMFHHTVNRYRLFQKALAEDRVGRAASISEDIRFLLEREAEAGTPVLSAGGGRTASAGNPQRHQAEQCPPGPEDPQGPVRAGSGHGNARLLSL